MRGRFLLGFLLLSGAFVGYAHGFLSLAGGHCDHDRWRDHGAWHDASDRGGPPGPEAPR